MCIYFIYILFVFCPETQGRMHGISRQSPIKACLVIDLLNFNMDCQRAPRNQSHTMSSSALLILVEIADLLESAVELVPDSQFSLSFTNTGMIVWSQNKCMLHQMSSASAYIFSVIVCFKEGSPGRKKNQSHKYFTFDVAPVCFVLHVQTQVLIVK